MRMEGRGETSVNVERAKDAKIHIRGRLEEAHVCALRVQLPRRLAFLGDSPTSLSQLRSLPGPSTRSARSGSDKLRRSGDRS